MSELAKLQYDVDEWAQRMRALKAVRDTGLSAQELAQRFAAAAGAAREASDAITQFGATLYSAAEAEYIEVHDRLPGSTRTKRLRKKRRDMVTRWVGGDGP